MSDANQFRRGRTAISIRKPPSSLARRLPVLLACMPKLGCPLCWPALAALCSFCGLPFAILNPLLIGITLLAIALLLITAVSRHTFSWSSGLLAAGLSANLGARFWTAPAWVAYVATALVFTALVAEFLLPRHFAIITPSPHCMHNCRPALCGAAQRRNHEAQHSIEA
jgi:hypothetical protein